MNPVEVGTLIIAGIAVASSIASVLLLAYRVGRLTGTVEARLQHGDTDRVNIWRQLGALAERLNRHIEGHGH